jgi:hypothetical protein
MRQSRGWGVVTASPFGGGRIWLAADTELYLGGASRPGDPRDW